MIKLGIRQAGAAASLFIFISMLMGICHAQSSVVPANQAETNRKLVLDFWRIVIEARDLDAAAQYVTPDFIQHNPVMASGIKGMAERFRILWNGEAKRPVEAVLRNPPTAVMADSDLVMLMWKWPTPEPGDPAKTYDRYTFDLYRVKDGKIVEHWDAVAKPN